MKRHRVFTGAITGAVVLAVLALDYYVVEWLPMAALLAVAAFAASYELCIILRSAGLETFPVLTAFASFVVALLPALNLQFIFGPSSWAPQVGVIFSFMILTFAVALRKMSHTQPGNANAGIKAVVSGVFVLIYIGFALSFLVRLRMLEPVGWTLLIFTIGCAKVGDIGAYFTGRALGKWPLAPRVSPKKTVEGAVGGLVGSLLVALLLAPFLKGEVSLVRLLCWAGALAVATQFGDMAESLLKRAGEVKDSSGVFGTLGGVLDGIDSLLLSAPTAYILALSGGFGGR